MAKYEYPLRLHTSLPIFLPPGSRHATRPGVMGISLYYYYYYYYWSLRRQSINNGVSTLNTIPNEKKFYDFQETLINLSIFKNSAFVKCLRTYGTLQYHADYTDFVIDRIAYNIRNTSNRTIKPVSISKISKRNRYDRLRLNV